MAGGMSVAALIPAFDCSKTIGRVVRGVREHLDTVLVVDDGSRDRTSATAKRSGAEVIRHDGNRGKGTALRTGLLHLAERGFTHAVALDGDGQHLPAEMPKLLGVLARAPRAIVIGERQIESEVAPINRFGNEFANLWVWIATGRRIPDTQSGFRVYPIAETLALGTSGARFELETEVLIRAVRAGMEIRSVPVRVYYPPPGVRASHYDGVWDTVRIIEMVVSLMLRIR